MVFPSIYIDLFRAQRTFCLYCGKLSFLQQWLIWSKYRPRRFFIIPFPVLFRQNMVQYRKHEQYRSSRGSDMLFDKLSIVVTDKCNAECEFCCLNCSPRNTNVRTEEELRRVIREAADLDGLKEICFTGGEPLLYMDLVETGSAFAKGLGLKSAVYTNGFWGSDSGQAGEWVQRLKAAGVYRIHFSADPSH